MYFICFRLETHPSPRAGYRVIVAICSQFSYVEHVGAVSTGMSHDFMLKNLTNKN